MWSFIGMVFGTGVLIVGITIGFTVAGVITTIVGALMIVGGVYSLYEEEHKKSQEKQIREISPDFSASAVRPGQRCRAARPLLD
jgi:hypothetical protein